MKTYRIERNLASGSVFILGFAYETERGWRFIPNVSGRISSRHPHPTLKACLPRWLGRHEIKEVK